MSFDKPESLGLLDDQTPFPKSFWTSKIFETPSNREFESMTSAEVSIAFITRLVPHWLGLKDSILYFAEVTTFDK